MQRAGQHAGQRGAASAAGSAAAASVAAGTGSGAGRAGVQPPGERSQWRTQALSARPAALPRRVRVGDTRGVCGVTLGGGRADLETRVDSSDACPAQGVWVTPEMWRTVKRQLDTKLEDTHSVVHEHNKARAQSRLSLSLVSLTRCAPCRLWLSCVFSWTLSVAATWTRRRSTSAQSAPCVRRLRSSGCGCSSWKRRVACLCTLRPHPRR